jgi:hypothetical protein
MDDLCRAGRDGVQVCAVERVMTNLGVAER